ncbi:MAG: autotransporter outer membrane beta-barrel domain-containing protein [Planctomycetaceae bacterium]|nr:autotransporter outer membrane beta-barrel domain-containing protein [Planctomycetaceae bacterium]
MMRHVFAFIVVTLLCVLAADAVLAAPPEPPEYKADFSLLPNQPIFSADLDLYLGQKRRRTSGSGRVWANAYYGGSTLKPKEGGKILPNLYGLQLGCDVAHAYDVFSTFFLNINESKIKFRSPNGSVSSTVDNYLLGYGKFCYFSLCHFAFNGSIGYDRYEIRKGYTGDGLQMNLFGEFGLDFDFDSWAIKPFYALQYDFLYHGNIGKSSASIKDWNGHGFQQLFGVRVNWKPVQNLVLQSRVTWVHEFLVNPPPFYHARFSQFHGIQTPAIMFHHGNTGRDWAWLGFGAKLEPVYDVYLFLDYDLLLNGRHVTHLGSLGLCLGW